MPVKLAVVADDFSGATEIAGVAHAAGLSVFLSRELAPEIPEGTEAVILDADSRRRSQEEAILIHENIAHFVHNFTNHIYKKTDSVLRGHILSEMQALAIGTHKKRVIFCPANPARNRCIRQGRYTINGISLHHTEFAKDPQFPVTTDHVQSALASKGQWTMPDFPNIPDATSWEDLKHISKSVDEQTLPAGASPFFSAFLERLDLSEKEQPKYSLPCTDSNLLVSGSISSVSRETAKQFRRNNCPVMKIHPNKPEILSSQSLNRSKISMLKITEEPLPNPESLPCLLAKSLHQLALPQHILIEGGDTSACILEQFGWDSFKILHQWEPGITTIQPTTPNAPLLTIKPGSYPWTKGLLEQFTHSTNATS